MEYGSTKGHLLLLIPTTLPLASLCSLPICIFGIVLIFRTFYFEAKTKRPRCTSGAQDETLLRIAMPTLYSGLCFFILFAYYVCACLCLCLCPSLYISLYVSLSVRLSMCVSTSSPRCTIAFPLGGSQRQDCREPPLLAWISAPADSPLPQTATARKALMYTPVL